MEMKDKRPRIKGLREEAREETGAEELAESSSDAPAGTDISGDAKGSPTVSVSELQALKADLENARKRMLREQTRATEYASKDLMRRLLPVIDHFQLAVEHGDAGEGVRLALKELMDVLATEGLQEIDVPVGTPFDPTIHHALATHPDPTVSQDVVSGLHRKGFRFKEQVLRAPEVVVAQPVDVIEDQDEQTLEI